MSSIDALQSIANDISNGFEALLQQLEAQKEVELDLRQQLTRTVERFNSNYSDSPSDGALSEWQGEIVKQIHTRPPNKRAKQTTRDNTTEITKARDAIHRLKADMAVSIANGAPRKCPVAHQTTDTVPPATNVTPHTCPVSLHTTDMDPPATNGTVRQCQAAHQKLPKPDYTEMEKDFTVPGKPSSLECPFAKMTRNGPLPPGMPDPIAAEFHQDSLSAADLDEARACGRCPIRFMDKHSPEEVAEYFEKHKHELPRSHEICVKRYQTNESQVRQLDEKYGNIVSMIQGLGNKHKQYLPSDEQGPGSTTDQKSTAAVENWAKDVSVNDVEPETTGAEAELDMVEEAEQRVSHFAKPLRDVRVGESPSRPWGISVPLDQPRAPSAVSSRKPLASPLIKQETPATDAKIVSDSATPTAASTTQSSQTSRRSRSRRRGSRRPQIVFNGPVFLGYTPEQAATFLEQLGQGRG